MMLAAIALAVAASEVPAAAPTKPVDCGKADRPVDRAICDDPELRALDARIARRYAHLLGALDRPSADALRRDQLWFVSARANATAVTGGRVDRADLADALAVRAAFLDAVIVRPTGLTGKWQNAAGDVTLTRGPGDHMVFDGGATDPQSARWTCGAGGSGKVRGGVATFAMVEGPGWTIAARRRGATLTLDERPPVANAGNPPYCGFNGRLSGDYFQVARNAQP
jgi:uncharacterized protein YecT (DUF1311 family)